jgi:transglutaminase-like putative cysteine protease
VKRIVYNDSLSIDPHACPKIPQGIEMLKSCLMPICPLFLCLVAGCSDPPGEVRGDGLPETRAAVAEATVAEPVGRSRSFRFNYRFDVMGIKPDAEVRIWMPVPTSSADQQITPLPHQLPAEPSFHVEPKYSNRILYLESIAPENGELGFDVPYLVHRREVLALDSATPVVDDKRLVAHQRELFLGANSKVPIDGKPLELLSNVELSDDTRERAKQLYDVVDQHVTYNKVGMGWGNGDVLWVCDSRAGNCTDFHSLFISLARSQGLPSRFEIGFPIPDDASQGNVVGYHCWAFFFTEQLGWVPVDISEADKHPLMKEYYFGSLTPDRIAFSTGRDIELMPKSDNGPLNYFIYPHVEVDGVSLPRKQIALKFSYADVAEQL